MPFRPIFPEREKTSNTSSPSVGLSGGAVYARLFQ
eukprot:gene34643-42731_t